MPPDPGPIEAARRARRSLIDAQQASDHARADFEHAIRRAHAAGMQFGEIADALSVSYQQVAQIVDAGPRRRWWRLRKVDPPRPRCTACGRTGTETGKLVAGPGVHICDRCVVLATAVVSERAPCSDELVRIDYLEHDTPREPGPGKGRTGCSFCGKRRVPGGAIVGTPALHICSDCLQLCREILTEEATP
jgi:hypothetical protein